jgi:uncharacterized membrane protein YhhN
VRSEVLTVVAAVIAAVAVLANWWSRVATRATAATVELVSKPAATVAIGVLAVAASDPDVSTAALVAGIIGFVLCLGGDVALLPAVDRFIVGLGSFLAGHLAFVVMFVLLGLDRPWLGVVALGGTAVVVVFVGRPILNGARAKDPSLMVPVRGYLSIISAMAVVGWSTGRPAAIAGSSLFVLSDSILGHRMFVASHRWAPLAVMVTYHGALLGLALTLAS